MNPAFGFGLNFVRLLITGDAYECKDLWIYLIGPTLGGVLAAYVYKAFYKVYFESKEKMKFSFDYK